MFGVNISQCVRVKDSVRPAATVLQDDRVLFCFCQSIGWESLGIPIWIMDIVQTVVHAIDAKLNRRLVLLVDLLAMGPVNPDESVRHDGGACCQTGLPCSLSA